MTRRSWKCWLRGLGEGSLEAPASDLGHDLVPVDDEAKQKHDGFCEDGMVTGHPLTGMRWSGWWQLRSSDLS
jgi:hypothetical protein